MGSLASHIGALTHDVLTYDALTLGALMLGAFTRMGLLTYIHTFTYAYIHVHTYAHIRKHTQFNHTSRNSIVPNTYFLCMTD